MLKQNDSCDYKNKKRHVSVVTMQPYDESNRSSIFVMKFVLLFIFHKSFLHIYISYSKKTHSQP